MANNPRPEIRPALRRPLVVFLILLWISGILIFFYITHKPLTGLAIVRLQEAFLSLAGAVWILWIAEGMGWRLTREEGLNPWERMALAGGLGLGALSLLALGIAAAGWISGIVVAIVLLILTVLFFRDSIRWITELAVYRPGLFENGKIFSIFCGIFVLLTILLSLGVALAPPVAWDALVYHLRIPQQILAARSLQLPGDSFFREMPHLSEMLSTAAFALTGRMETATVMGWSIGLLTLVGMVGTAKRMGIRYPLLAPAILLSGDTLARSMGWGYVDWTTALFGYAAVCAISRRETGWRWVLLAGVYAGLAFGAKYTAGILLPIILVWTVFAWRRRSVLKDTLLILAGFSLAFAPWLVRNFVLWGNPLPPLMDAGEGAVLRLRFFSGPPFPNAWWIAGVMPFLQSTIGRYEAPPFGATIGPLLLAFLPGLFFLRRKNADAERFPLVLLGLCALTFWIVPAIGVFFSEGLAQPRLFMALFPAMGLLAACAFDGLMEIQLGQIRVRSVAITLTVLVMAAQWTGNAIAWIGSGLPAYSAGATDSKNYLEDNLGWYSRAMDSIQSLPEGSRVLMLWEPRGLYCGEVCVEDATIDRWYLAMRMQGDVEKILEGWKSEGYTHMLIYNAGAEFERAQRHGYLPSDWEALTQLRSRLVEESNFAGFYTLYRIGSDH